MIQSLIKVQIYWPDDCGLFRPPHLAIPDRVQPWSIFWYLFDLFNSTL